jgi:hypothetical protein
VIDYRGYTIAPKQDFGLLGGLRADGRLTKVGYVVVKGGCNAMPGATWFHTIEGAKEAIDVLDDVGGDANRFWQRMRGAS